MTFKNLYLREKEKPTAAELFIDEVARITRKSKATVKMWLTSKQTPDELTRTIIAKHFKVDANSLFPKN